MKRTKSIAPVPEKQQGKIFRALTPTVGNYTLPAFAVPAVRNSLPPLPPANIAVVNATSTTTISATNPKFSTNATNGNERKSLRFLL